MTSPWRRPAERRWTTPAASRSSPYSLQRGAEPGRLMKSIVEGVDHLGVTTWEPAELLPQLADVLGLPIETPVRSFARGGFEVVTGLLSVVNTRLEFVRHETARRSPPPATRGIDALCFSPPSGGLVDVVRELDERGIRHTP